MATTNQLLKAMSESLGCPEYKAEQFDHHINIELLNAQAGLLPDSDIAAFLGDDPDGDKIVSLLEQYDIIYLSSFLDGVFNGDIEPIKVLS